MLARRLNEKMTVTLRTSAGHQFKGEFGNPNSFPRPRREVQNIPHSVLAVGKNSLARDGDVVSYKGTHFLLCGQHHLTEVRLFLALQIQNWVSWERMSEAIDPVLMVKKDGVRQTLDARLPVILNPVKFLEEVSFQKPVYQMLTGADVREGDIINDKLQVLQVSKLLGIQVAEVSG